MQIKEIIAKSILRKSKKIDSWFISQYFMNLYRGCEHNCIYCDGRHEKYQVDGIFEDEISVKINAIDILEKELNPKNKRKPLKKCFIMLGGGVCDSYQPIEKKYEITKQVLEIIYKYNYPVHILTKSTMVKRDIDILKKINQNSRAIVSFSLSSADDSITKAFEPRASLASEKLEAIEYFKNEGINSGIFLMPVIPFITDTYDMIENTIKNAVKVSADYIVFGGMTLKEGKQKDYFYDFLKNFDENLIYNYLSIYKDDNWGSATKDYYIHINKIFHNLSRKYNIPKRIPMKIFCDVLDENDKIQVMLEQLDYLIKQTGKTSPYGYAANSISKLDRPISEIRNSIRNLKGVGPFTQKLILEILDTGNCKYYEDLI